MESKSKTTITVKVYINAPVNLVWECWTKPEHIVNWNNASVDWYTPTAKNDLRAGGSFSYRMEARDGTMGFDFSGVYQNVAVNDLIEYTIGDGRKVKIVFIPKGNTTDIVETFDAEDVHPIEHQQFGWQSILNNFKSYVENK
jgi:uncharacterized protein YndB with AHSA1/START domain